VVRVPSPSTSALLAFGAAVALGCVCVPLTTPFFPSVDLWNHLAVVEAQYASLTGKGPLAALYGVQPSVYPYGLIYLPMLLWRHLVGPQTLGAITVALCNLSAMLGVVALLWACAVPRVLWLLALGTAFSMPVWYGFVPYAAGLGPALGAVAALLHAQRVGGARPAVLAAALFGVTWWCHVEAFAAAGLLALCAALVPQDRWKRVGLLALVSAPSVLGSLHWLSGHRAGAPMVFQYGPPKDRLGAWQAYHLWAEGPLGILTPALVMAAGGAGFLWAIRRWKSLSPSERTVMGLVLGATILHLALPKAVTGGSMAAWGQSVRTGVFTTAVAAVAAAFLPARMHAALAVSVGVGALGMGLQAQRFASAFSQEVAPLADHFRAHTPPGLRTVVLAADGADRVGQSTLHHLEHVGGLWVLHGAVSHQFFTVPGTRITMPDPQALPPVASDIHAPACAFAGRLDAVLTQGSRAEWDALLPQGGFEPVFSSGRWTVWQRQTPAAPCP
jgi:hypothetical protein